MNHNPDPNDQYLSALSSDNDALDEYNRIFLGSIRREERDDDLRQDLLREREDDDSD